MIKSMSSVGVAVVAWILPKFCPEELLILTVFILILLTIPGFIIENCASKLYWFD